VQQAMPLLFPYGSLYTGTIVSLTAIKCESWVWWATQFCIYTCRGSDLGAASSSLVGGELSRLVSFCPPRKVDYILMFSR
jgi:hypothetical protein